MSISYSGIVGYGKASLISVESWGTNNNILKDPPRSITTRRKDRVGSNSQITEDIEMSRDRIAENITAYPRGVNPMVAVSYNGQGNSGMSGISSGSKQAKLPYRVAMNGAFRPPVLAPVDLLPLSRMPRNVTKVYSSICNPDFTKKITCGTNEKNIKHNLIVECKPKTYINIKKPSVVGVQGNISQVQNLVRNVNIPIQYPQKRINIVNNRRQENTRKNIKVKDMTVPNIYQKGNTRNVLTGMDLSKTKDKVLLAGKVQSNSSQNKFVNRNISNGSGNNTRQDILIASMQAPKNIRRETSGAGTLNAKSYISSGVSTEANAPKRGHNKYQPMPSIISNCRENVFNAEMAPSYFISREADKDRPQYRRVYGRGGILVPEGGLYNN